MTNSVIKGDYKGKRISIKDEGINLYNNNENFEKKKDEIKSYKSIIKTNKITVKNFLQCIIGFIIGGIIYAIIANNFMVQYSRPIYGLNEMIRLFTILGAIILTGLASILVKPKITHIIIIEFNDGKKSLIELEEKQYNKFKIMMF